VSNTMENIFQGVSPNIYRQVSIIAVARMIRPVASAEIGHRAKFWHQYTATNSALGQRAG
jgi:hypothetical protein